MAQKKAKKILKMVRELVLEWLGLAQTINMITSRSFYSMYNVKKHSVSGQLRADST